MDDFQGQIELLEEKWSVIKQVTEEADETLWSKYVPNGSLVLVDEMFTTIIEWLSKSRAPRGFASGFQMSRQLSKTHIGVTLTLLEKIERLEFNQYPVLLERLLRLISTLHAMLVFSSTEHQGASVADLSIELANSIAILQTAQTELSEKIALLHRAESVNEDYARILIDVQGKKATIDELYEEVKSKVSSIQEESVEASDSIADDTRKVSELVAQVKDDAEKVKGLKVQMELMTSENEAIKIDLGEARKVLLELQEDSIEQNKVIYSILPKAASVGLADAFSHRSGKLEVTKWVWMAAFIISLGALFWGGQSVVTELKEVTGGNGINFWESFLIRVPLAIPLVWIAWFSAVQYGNIIRVQEDYAFKEATSKAFQGYRDHMEHLASVNVGEAGSVLTQLSSSTVEILGREPLRIYESNSSDAGFTSFFKRNKTE